MFEKVLCPDCPMCRWWDEEQGCLRQILKVSGSRCWLFEEKHRTPVFDDDERQGTLW